MNSKGVTPVGANVPLPSTSNFLIGATMPLIGSVVSDRMGQQPQTKRFQQALKSFKDSQKQREEGTTEKKQEVTVI